VEKVVEVHTADSERSDTLLVFFLLNQLNTRTGTLVSRITVMPNQPKTLEQEKQDNSQLLSIRNIKYVTQICELPNKSTTVVLHPEFKHTLIDV